jgi:hypothetical protein
MDDGINCDDLGTYATNGASTYDGLVVDKDMLESLKEIMAKMPQLPSRTPHFDIQPLAYKADDFVNFSWLTGLPIITPTHTLTTERWEPPTDPFIEFEPRDFSWLKALGFGKVIKSRAAYFLDRRPFITAYC